MSPQFVDFDQDGALDIVAGTFDGSPHWARGTETGFAAPQQILDQDGERIVMNQFWNFATEPPKWDETARCDPETGLQHAHLTSAWAVDFDADGDLDLLLGDHGHGYVMLRENLGAPGKPAFAPKNRLIHAGGAPLVLPGTVATLRTIDLDQDGRFDLLLSSMGDAYGEGPGGGVYWCRNEGAAGAPAFAAPEVLIAPSARGASKATRPDAGLYADAADLDGDGDLDLLVGGYSTWREPPPPLDADGLRQAAALRAQLQEIAAEMERAMAALAKAADGESAASKDAKKELQARFQAVIERRQQTQRELEKFEPGVSRRSFVWRYVNLSR